MFIIVEEFMILLFFIFLLELFGVFVFSFYLIVLDIVIVLFCFLFLMILVKVVIGRVVVGVYLKGRDIDVVFFIIELLCMNIMLLGIIRRLDIVMGCCVCCLFWNNCCFVVLFKLEVMILIIWLFFFEICK